MPTQADAPTGTPPAQPGASSSAEVPVKRVSLYTAPWVVILLVLLALPSLGAEPIKYETYLIARRIVSVALIVLAIGGLYRALRQAGPGVAPGKPWYTSAFLVSLVLFWGLAPPTWFFTEYYLFDQGHIALPDGETDKAKFLAMTKNYADFASKIWVAVGAALATAIGFSKR